MSDVAYLRLAGIPDIGPVLIKRALDYFKTPEAVLVASPASLSAIEGVGTHRANCFSKAPTQMQAEDTLAAARAKGISLLTPAHENWPAGLKNIPDPPIVLYVRGTITQHDALAIGVVGSRKCTHYGREQATLFGSMLAQAGLTVISGGARGIDTGSHEGALRVGGRTIVVQGCGMCNVYPPENAELYERIIACGRGAVISELPLEEPPTAENFPPRNRIIAGMSLGVLVVEGTMRSGSLITARLAGNDYNREVFAIPGRVDSAASAGTHHLIKTGCAHLVENAQDILEILGDVGEALGKITREPPAKDVSSAASAVSPASSTMAKTSSTPLFSNGAAEKLRREVHETATSFTGVQRRILEALAQGVLNADQLCEKANASPGILMAELTMLQIRGVIKRTGDNRFMKA